MERNVRIGLYGIGLDTYWPQFEGLRARLEGYQTEVAGLLRDMGAEVVDVGIVDNAELARSTGDRLREGGVMALFLSISTYALSETVLPVAQRVGVPVIVLNLQPVAKIDYEQFNSLDDRGVMTGEWLAHCQACCVPEIAGVFKRAGIPYHVVTGYLHEEYARLQINNWLDAVRVRRGLQTARIGILGHYYGGMLDVYTDITSLASVFGIHFEILEMCKLKEYRDQVRPEQTENKMYQFHEEFAVSPDCDEEEIRRAARTSCALDQLVEKNRLGALAYYYEGTNGNEYENIVTSIIAGNTRVRQASDQ